MGRAINDIAVRAPWAWRLLRRPVARFFSSAADGWDERLQADSAEHLAPILAALDRVAPVPRRILDIGTGTGAAALMLARRFPDAEVFGVDLSADMIAAAKRKAGEQSSQAEFRVADIAQLQDAGGYDLTTMLNMPPFFAPVSELVAPGGYVINGSSFGDRTPFYTSPATMAKGFERHGLETVATGAAGNGTFYIARRPRG